VSDTQNYITFTDENGTSHVGKKKKKKGKKKKGAT